MGIVCPRCGAENPTGASFCSACTENLASAPIALIGSEGISETVAVLCNKLGISNPPSDVYWMEKYYGPNAEPNPPPFDLLLDSSRAGMERRRGIPVDPEFPVIVGNKILLKPMLQGKLEMKEWTPLIASSLIYYRQLKRKNSVGFVVRMAPALALLGVLFFLAAEGKALPITPVEYILFGVIVVPSALVIGTLSAIRYSKSLGFIADRRAAEILGKNALLSALLKLDSIKQQDIANGRRGEWVGWGVVPDLTKRIENLQKAAPDPLLLV